MSTLPSLLHPLLPTTLPTILLTLLLLHLLHLLLYDPHRHLPGPWHARLSPPLWLHHHAYTGDESTQISRLHRRYGPVVRIARNDVSISDGAALAPVYAEKGGFLKAQCYRNFDFEGRATVFSALDVAYRAVRVKAVGSLFGMGRVRAGAGVVEACVERFVARLEGRRRRKKGGTRVDVLGLCRALALDAVSSYLFGRGFGGLEEEEEEEEEGGFSAGGFVDFFVAVGRFFLLPPWLFEVVDGVVGWVVGPDWEAEESVRVVGEFARGLVEGVGEEGRDDDDDDTFQARLLRAGIEKEEVKVQIEDLIFAGTDSTGMNLSMLCWNLARHPHIYRTLRDEVLAADAQDPTGTYHPLTLPYLTATLRETLRTSLANPTRFPRVVPPQGLAFYSPQAQKPFFIPPFTTVGLQPHTLHFNPAVYPEPRKFDPERWLRAPSAEMQRDFFPFGVGARQCIARNLAMMELALAARALARSGVLVGAEAVGEEVEILEWFNSRVRSGRVELVWR
ncbi:cytochrome P450 [Teratosphaeria nubilosa]|uniref:Cytochrome P450 n=1 Tax=Teratosphaeria nubilosa TaxID=161662 RepID=A0A6G1KUZ8_9PEZI|nr:cytochrome P450 [Teratosphaeria nubilosa]